MGDRQHRNARMLEASIVLLFQTKRARTDQTVKSAVLACQAKGIPIISIDTDHAESTLSMGLDPHAYQFTLDME